LVKTKHQTVLVVPYAVPYCVSNKCQKTTLYDKQIYWLAALPYWYLWLVDCVFSQHLQAKYNMFLHSVRSAVILRKPML